MTEDVIANGKVIASHIRDGIYYRASDGSIFNQFKTLDGNPTVGQQAWAPLRDSNGVNYQLDYVQHRAYYVAPRPQFTPPSRTNAQKTQSSVEGIPCTIQPVYLVSGGSQTLIGHACLSEKYELSLKMEFTMPLKVGQSVHEVTELYNIQLGQEPDPRLFDLHNFTIYRPDAAQQSPAQQSVIH